MVLDNEEIVEKSTFAEPDGECVYKNKVRKAELEWLAKDLALVDKSTPVVLAMHAPLACSPGHGGRVPLCQRSQTCLAPAKFDTVEVIATRM